MRWLSFSFLCLLAIWLLANDSLAPGQVVLGALLALLLPFSMRWLRPLQAHPGKPLVALRLLGRVTADVVESNLTVGKVILGRREPRSAFMDVPLALRDPHGLALLLTILTANPGTVWAGLSEDGAVLRMHVLDLVDEERWLHIVKDRYEADLMEIFE